ncbi:MULTISPECIES: histidine kinase [Enterocloster]|uniref:Cache domain-containing protein n=1 Tax=Enterocloster lavalensis TaxID=460384 RepID=A0A1I0HLK7_9FIRM|nr:MULTISPECIES: histidine kinase [Enterocloster]MDR3759538.1 histidine kinase [Enterocloster sp.]SET83989.1 Cache domain-containing protein [Enterocloster lavalensis]
MKFKRSFSVHLLISFLISTLIPFMLIAYVVAHIYAREYSRDVRSLLDTTASSLDSNIATYLKELEQVTMQPYYNNELYNYLRGLSRDQDYALMERLNLQRNLDSNMSFVRYTREDINGIFIVTGDRCLYYTITGTDHKTLSPSFDYGQQSWYQEAVRADGRCLLIGPHVPDYITPRDTPVISLARSIVVLESRDPLYVIKIDVNTRIFDRLFQNFTFHVDSKIIIKDENQRIIYANRPLSDEDRETLENTPGAASVSLSDGSFQRYVYPITGYPWDITVLLSNQELNSRTGIIYLTALLLYLAGVVMAMASFRLSSKKMVASINSMRGIFYAIQNEDFSRKYTYVSDTELDDLGDSLNAMSEELQNRIQKEYVMAIRQKDTEFKALQAQIQPHFLFNTLNNFVALNQVGDRDALENALFELSGMLRYILKAPALIPLSMELSFVEDYCSLQKLRFSDRLNYVVDRQVPAEGIMIPKLLLQPIVENSILHGVEPCNRACTIRISLSPAAHGVIIVVEDDGAGCELPEGEAPGIGLANVRERLASFSPQSSFSMESRPGEGTRTVIELYIEAMEETIS